MLGLTSIALFFITFTVQPFRIPSASMEPTLMVGDFLLVDKHSAGQRTSFPLPSSGLRRGDVVVFHDPINASLYLVKRIIAVPGDRIRLRAGRVLLNGHVITEPYAVYRLSAPNLYRDNFPNAPSPDSEVDARWWIQLRRIVDHGELVIPASSYFVLGDNRNDSLDSRYWGLVPFASIVGKPLLIYLSLKPSVSEAAPEKWKLTDLVARYARWNRTLTLVH